MGTTASALPQTGTWEIDPAHSTIEFVVRHLGFSNVRGRFGEFSGTIVVDDHLENSTATLSISMASIDTRDQRRDDHLRGADFFDVEKFPTAEFRTTTIAVKDSENFTITGELSIHGVTKTISFNAEHHGSGGDPWGGHRVGFSANAEIDREDFGLTWNQVLETGSFLVGKKVKIEIEIEAAKKA